MSELPCTVGEETTVGVGVMVGIGTTAGVGVTVGDGVGVGPAEPLHALSNTSATRAAAVGSLTAGDRLATRPPAVPPGTPAACLVQIHRLAPPTLLWQTGDGLAAQREDERPDEQNDRPNDDEPHD